MRNEMNLFKAGSEPALDALRISVLEPRPGTISRLARAMKQHVEPIGSLLTARCASRGQSQDMGQILAPILFSVLCQKVGTPHPGGGPSPGRRRGAVAFTPPRRCARVLPVS